MKKTVLWLALLAMVLLAAAACANSCDEGNHPFGPWLTHREPTCFMVGDQIRYCRGCDHWENRDIPKLKHEVEEWTVTREPSCVKKGTREGVCTLCHSPVKKYELVLIREKVYNREKDAGGRWAEMKVQVERKAYETDITDEQWKEIEPLFAGMRKRTWSKRELTNAVLYLNKTGCQWRNLPHDFPPYKTVSSFYCRAKTSGLWDRILEHLVEKVRIDSGKNASPSYGLVDSQSAKTVAASEDRGIDGGKKQKVEKDILS